MAKRNTSQRTAIESVFHQQNRPLAIDEILVAGRKKVETLNQATVYRNLKRLVKDGWLIKINHPSFGTLYERSGKKHHHHFHCNACNRVFEFPGCLMDDKKAAPRGFIVKDHEVFLFGVCPDCDRIYGF
ncbi:transcriptional repressor [candidate division KSB1 bacterium]|nr:transcriptional repressor [candidate division KSB1 bacterium]